MSEPTTDLAHLLEETGEVLSDSERAELREAALGRPRHPTTTLPAPFTGDSVEIDNGMVELIQTLWAFGFETDYCCEDNSGRAYVSFTGFLSALRFARIVGLGIVQFEAFDSRGPMFESTKYGPVGELGVTIEFVAGDTRSCIRFNATALPVITQRAKAAYKDICG